MNSSVLFPLELDDSPPDRNYYWISDILLINNKLNETLFDCFSVSSLDPLYSFIALTSIYSISFILNIFVLLSTQCQHTTRKSMKIKFLVGLLQTVNAISSAVWIAISLFCYFFFIETQNDAIVNLLDSDDQEDIILKEGIWEFFAHQLVDNVVFIQSIVLLAITFDRYLNLFQNYSAYLENACLKVLLVIFPVVVAATVFDHRIVGLLVDENAALFCRLCLLLIPSFLSFLFCLITVIRPAPPGDYRYTSSLNKSLPFLLLLFSLLDIFYKTAFFFELLERNFHFVIVTGSAEGDETLTEIFEYWQRISVWMLHIFPLYSALFMILLVRHYRSQCADCIRRCCCCRRNHLDYSSETMRSILAEQRKQQNVQMMSSIH